ncbi:unnamed protein product [Notodromas monacha]|uniref:Uncharacterized protein n=1 Tax=Notodromas monacha TaxID=399045 RepID=A0A7R9GE42_9CRUS|nr:unnamed protein product [Notodromas monacha]CAG0917870.1 unnamed protein product [Notodromas monacha]
MDYSLRCMKEIPRVPYAANVINAVTSAEKQLKDARIPLLSSVIEGGESVANWILSFKLIAMFVAFADWSLTKALQVALFCAEKTASLLTEPKTAVQHANNSAAEVTEDETEEQMTSEPEKPAVEHRAPRRYSYEAKEQKPIISDEEVSPKNESSESPTPAVAEINGEDDARIPLLSSVIEGGESVANWILSFKLIAMFVAFADWSLTKTLQVALFCAEKTASLLAEPKTAVQHANNSAAEVTEETEEQMTSEPEKPAVEHRAPRRYSYEAKELKPIISDEEVSPKNESSESPTPAVAEINGEDEEWKTAERGYDEVDEEESVDEPADEPEPTVQVEECDDDEGGEDVDYGEFAEEMDGETNKSAEEGDLTGGHD